jgi:MFS family permease
LTFIIRSGPFSDIYATVYAYKISEHCAVPSANPIDQKFHNINIFAQYRKYGSVGWAAIAPLGGLLINKFDFGLNFVIGGVGFILLSIFAAFHLKEHDVISQNEDPANPPLDPKKVQKMTIGKSFRKISLNKYFIAFMIATLLFSLATTMTYQTQGIFYGLFAPNDYFIVALTFSLAAFIEWPFMTIVAKRVKKIGWERAVILAYLLTAVRLGLSPLLLLFNGNIWGAFLLQVLAGIIFGIRLPSATFGVYAILKNDQRTFGQSLNVSMQHVGSFLGSLIGAIVAFIIQDSVSNTFLVIYWIAAIFALISSIWFYLQITRKFRYAGVSS